MLSELSITDRVTVAASRVTLGRMPAGMGQFRVADRIYGRRMSHYPRGTLVRTRMQGGACLDLDVSDYVESRVALVRQWQPAVVAFAAARLRNEGVMFDVGAHVGVLALAIAAARSDARPEIHAFEPLPVNVERLRRNVALNAKANVKVNGVAVGADAGSVEIAAPDPRVPSMGYVAESGEVGGDTVTVPVVALDDYARENGIDAVDVLKIDVEGYEPHVLEGAERLLGERRVRAVVCELNQEGLEERDSSPAAVVATFARHGYQRHPLPNVGVRRWTSGLLKHSFDDAVFLPE